MRLSNGQNHTVMGTLVQVLYIHVISTAEKINARLKSIASLYAGLTTHLHLIILLLVFFLTVLLLHLLSSCSSSFSLRPFCRTFCRTFVLSYPIILKSFHHVFSSFRRSYCARVVVFETRLCPTPHLSHRSHVLNIM